MHMWINMHGLPRGRSSADTVLEGAAGLSVPELYPPLCSQVFTEGSLAVKQTGKDIAIRYRLHTAHFKGKEMKATW